MRRTPSNLGRARVEISGHKPVLEALQRSSRRGSDSRKQGLRALASRPPSRVAAFQGAWRTRKPVLCQDRHPLQGGRLETGCIHGRMGVGRFPRRIRCFAEAVVRIDTPAAAWPTSQPGSASTCAPPWPPTSVPSSTARTSPSPRPAQSSRRLQRQVRPEAFRVDGTHKMSKSKDGPLLCSCRTLLNRFDDLIAQELSEIFDPESFAGLPKQNRLAHSMAKGILCVFCEDAAYGLRSDWKADFQQKSEFSLTGVMEYGARRLNGEN